MSARSILYTLLALPRSISDNSRSFATVAGITSSANAISSIVVCLPKLNRNVPRASSALIPIAVNTCDGSTAPDEHAAPVEHASPFKSSAITNASPSIPANVIFVVFGVRTTSAPFTRASATRSINPPSSSSLNLPTLSASPASAPRAISAAFPSPTIPATFSVPGRNPR